MGEIRELLHQIHGTHGEVHLAGGPDGVGAVVDVGTGKRRGDAAEEVDVAGVMGVTRTACAHAEDDTGLDAALERLDQALRSPVTFLAWMNQQPRGKSLGTAGASTASPLARYLSERCGRHLGVGTREICVYGPRELQTVAATLRTVALVRLPPWARDFERAICEVPPVRAMDVLQAILLVPPRDQVVQTQSGKAAAAGVR